MVKDNQGDKEIFLTPLKSESLLQGGLHILFQALAEDRGKGKMGDKNIFFITAKPKERV